MADNTLKAAGIDHVAIMVTDRVASRKWYKEMFGFEALDGGKNPDSPYIGNESTKLALIQAENPSAFVPQVNQGPRACHFALETDGPMFEKYQRRLTEQGIEYEKLVHSDCESIYFSDPDAYLLEVTTYEIG